MFSRLLPLFQRSPCAQSPGTVLNRTIPHRFQPPGVTVRHLYDSQWPGADRERQPDRSSGDGNEGFRMVRLLSGTDKRGDMRRVKKLRRRNEADQKELIRAERQIKNHDHTNRIILLQKQLAEHSLDDKPILNTKATDRQEQTKPPSSRQKAEADTSDAFYAIDVDPTPIPSTFPQASEVGSPVGNRQWRREQQLLERERAKLNEKYGVPEGSTTPHPMIEEALQAFQAKRMSMMNKRIEKKKVSMEKLKKRIKQRSGMK